MILVVNNKQFNKEQFEKQFCEQQECFSSDVNCRLDNVKYKKP